MYHSRKKCFEPFLVSFFIKAAASETKMSTLSKLITEGAKIEKVKISQSAKQFHDLSNQERQYLIDKLRSIKKTRITKLATDLSSVVSSTLIQRDLPNSFTFNASRFFL